MTKFRTRIAVGLVGAIGVAAMATAIASAGASTGHAAASTTTTSTTLAPPVQGDGGQHVFFSVDTVQGAGGKVKLPADAGCSMTNLFQRGEVVVFRMWHDLGWVAFGQKRGKECQSNVIHTTM